MNISKTLYKLAFEGINCFVLVSRMYSILLFFGGQIGFWSRTLSIVAGWISHPSVEKKNARGRDSSPFPPGGGEAFYSCKYQLNITLFLISKQIL